MQDLAEPAADPPPWRQLTPPSGPCAGAALVHAPPSFTHDGEPVVFVDIGRVEASLELDFHFADQGGLLPVLQDFYESYAGKIITTGDLLAFLNERSSLPLNDFFSSKVYAGPR